MWYAWRLPLNHPRHSAVAGGVRSILKVRAGRTQVAFLWVRSIPSEASQTRPLTQLMPPTDGSPCWNPGLLHYWTALTFFCWAFLDLFTPWVSSPSQRCSPSQTTANHFCAPLRIHLLELKKHPGLSSAPQMPALGPVPS